MADAATPIRPGNSNAGFADGTGNSPRGPSGSDFVTRDELAAELQKLRGDLRADMRWDLLIQTLTLVAVLLTIYFGTVASNQAAGTLGYSIAQTADAASESAANKAAEKARAAVVEELDRREAAALQRAKDLKAMKNVKDE